MVGSRVATIACSMCLVVAAPRAAGQAVPARHILLLHQAGSPGSFRSRFDLAFAEAVRTDDSAPIELYEEVVESHRFPGAGQLQLLRDFLQKKYEGRTIDVIVAQGVGPLAFARQNRELFGRPPVVTIVSPSGLIASNDGVTGLQGGFFISGTVDLALALLPDTRSVYVIDGARQNDDELQAEVERQLKPRTGLTLVYLRDRPMPEVLSRVAAAPPHSIVFFIKQTMMSRTENIEQREALKQVVRASPAPVFGQLEEFLGLGIVGGSIWRSEEDARRLAVMARTIANGARVREVEPGRATYSIMLDWRQLQRWGIPESRIPPASVVLYRQPSFFELYRKYVAGALAIFIVQLALIGGLLVQRSRSKRATEAIRDLAGRLIASQEEERQRLARELHDGIGQKIALLSVEIAQVPESRSLRGWAASLQRTSEQIGEIATDIHNLSYALHPSKLQILGLTSAMRALCRDMSAAGGVQVVFANGRIPASIDPEISLCVYRITQETLRNVARHSRASQATVRLKHERGQLLLDVADSGVGFNARAGHEGLGLVSMRERVAFLRGRLAIQTRPGGGTRISVRIPLGQAAFETPPVSRAAPAHVGRAHAT
jgi:signal transduction histidine kinase